MHFDLNLLRNFSKESSSLKMGVDGEMSGDVLILI